MNTSRSSGDVLLQYGSNGLQFTIDTPSHVSLTAIQNSPRSWPRTLTALVVALGVFIVPNVSRAATYTGGDLVKQTNAVRVAQGLNELTTSATLEQAARAKANDMLDRQYFNHYGPKHESPWTFFSAAGYRFTSAGENLAMDYIDGKDVVAAWMSSASHRTNLLNANYRDIGIAVVDGTMNGSPTTVVVQFFGSRSVAAAPVVTSAPQPKPTPVAASTVQPKVAPKVTVVTPAPVQVTPTLVTKIVPIPQLASVSPDPAAVLSSMLAPKAEVQGVATKVIPSSIIPATTTMNTNPQIALLALATLGTYLLILSSVGIVTARLQKQRSEQLVHVLASAR